MANPIVKRSKSIDLVSLGLLITPTVTYAVRPELFTRRLFVQNDTCSEVSGYVDASVSGIMAYWLLPLNNIELAPLYTYD